MSNTQNGVRVNPLREWAAFDQLPPPIRRVIALAPFDYKVSDFFKAYKQHTKDGRNLSSFKLELVRTICDDLQYQCRKTYGADHPDAVYSRLDKRRAP